MLGGLVVIKTSVVAATGGLVGLTRWGGGRRGGELEGEGEGEARGIERTGGEARKRRGRGAPRRVRAWGGAGKGGGELRRPARIPPPQHPCSCSAPPRSAPLAALVPARHAPPPPRPVPRHLPPPVRSEAIRTGFMLSQGGEFAFVLLSLANQLRILPTNLNQLLIIVVGGVGGWGAGQAGGWVPGRSSGGS